MFRTRKIKRKPLNVLSSCSCLRIQSLNYDLVSHSMQWEYEDMVYGGHTAELGSTSNAPSSSERTVTNPQDVDLLISFWRGYLYLCSNSTLLKEYLKQEGFLTDQACCIILLHFRVSWGKQLSLVHLLPGLACNKQLINVFWVTVFSTVPNTQ